jgi:glycosyltransferase involved in cell wall biosynthesis
MKKRAIVLDCDRMKFANTGLYHYCLQLGLALKKQINNEIESLSYYVRAENINILGEDEHYIIQHSLDKFHMPTKNIDLWHCTFQVSNYFPFRKKIKIVYTIHDLNVLHEEGLSEKRLNKELAKIQKRINRADHIIAISNFTLQDIKKNLKIGNTPTTVIYNGCNFTKLNHLETPLINTEKKFLFTIGSINKKKNFHVLPSLLFDNNKMLIIAGITDDEDYKKKIMDEAKNYNAADRLIFVGAINENDKQWYMKNCEAFVFPSLAEGFGLPVIEAMYFGKPVILSNLTALPEIGGEVAYYFNSFKPEEMRAILHKSLLHYKNTPDAKEKISERAKMFNWDDAAKKYLDVYRSLLHEA